MWGDGTLLDWFHLARSSCPEKVAVQDRRGRSVTFAQLDRSSARVAGWLSHQGIAAGDVVSVQLPNWVEFIEAFVACLKIGAIINPVPTNLREWELRHIFTRCNTVASIHPTFYKNTNFVPLVADMHATEKSLRVSIMVGDNHVRAGQFTEWSDVVENATPLDRRDEYRGQGSNPAAILFTSGSEARPKGVVLTHNNLAANVQTFAQQMNLTWDDRLFIASPLGHATGFFYSVVMTIVSRLTVIQCDSTNPQDMVDFMAETRATGTMGVPTLVENVLQDSMTRKIPLDDLRFIVCAGAPIPQRLVPQASNYGVQLVALYGATEAAPLVMTSLTDPPEVLQNSDGRACSGVEIRIVDRETREELPDGQEGELVARGPSVFDRYLGEPEITERSLTDDGWYFSGDLATKKDGGLIRIGGRIKDTIIRGGENISVSEIEEIIEAMPTVEQAAVFGVDDARLGQKACAVIVTNDGTELTVDDLKKHFVIQGIAKYKIPEYVVTVDELPMTASGKIDRVNIKERFGSIGNRPPGTKARSFA